MDSATAVDTETASDRAQREIDTLRSGVESRLAALEAVLADPMRGESLEGLILDLARITSEEARATARKAALDVKLEADARVVLQSIAQESVEQERSAAQEARRELEQARQKIATLEQTQMNQLRSVRETLEAEMTREREARVRFERAAAEAERQLAAERAGTVQLRKAVESNQNADAEIRRALEAEHAASGELRTALDAERAASADLRARLDAERTVAAGLRETADRGEATASTLAREKAEAWTALEALTADLARERDAAVKQQRQFAELQAQLQLERTMSAELRQNAEQVEQQLASVSNDKARVSQSQEELQLALETLRSEAQALRADLSASGARLEMLDGERLKADSTRQDLEARLDALARERDELAAKLAQAIQAVTRNSASIAPVEASASPAASAPVQPPAPAATPAPAGPVAIAKPAGDTEWAAVRLAVRYTFSQPVSVQINGDAGVLVDLSTAGCQFVSPSAVRPNQVVKVMLQSTDAPIACTGRVMWARFEARAAGGAFGYRAGVQFTKPDQPALEGFIARSKAT